jgi:hypothetical protein
MVSENLKIAAVSSAALYFVYRKLAESRSNPPFCSTLTTLQQKTPLITSVIMK